MSAVLAVFTRTRHMARREALRGSFEQMKYIETAPGGQDAPGGARYDPLKAGSVACRPSACPSTGRRRGGEASAAIDARGQPRGQPGDLCSTTGNLTTPPVVHDTRSGTLWVVWGSVSALSGCRWLIPVTRR